MMSFNPRPRTGGDSRRSIGLSLMMSFNPRPRTGGDDQVAWVVVFVQHVSIRAPARGATVCALTALKGYI